MGRESDDACALWIGEGRRGLMKCVGRCGQYSLMVMMSGKNALIDIEERRRIIVTDRIGAMGEST